MSRSYVRKIEEGVEVPFRRVEALPDTEFQVDCGTGAWIVGVDGKRKKADLLRSIPSICRKAYSEESFTQEAGKKKPGTKSRVNVALRFPLCAQKHADCASLP